MSTGKTVESPESLENLKRVGDGIVSQDSRLLAVAMKQAGKLVPVTAMTACWKRRENAESRRISWTNQSRQETLRKFVLCYAPFNET